MADIPPLTISPARRLGLDFAVIGIMWRREMLRYRRDRSQIFGAISRTVLWLLILGFGLGAALREIEGYAYQQYILPGVITLNILFSSLQCAIALVWDREVGLLRSVIVSPASMLSVTIGKVLGGATISLFQGAIPLLLIPFLGLKVGITDLAFALVVMFFMGLSITAGGIILAARLKSFEGFGAISNGLIQPLYFLSGSIFPLKGVIGGVGFLDIPMSIRDELRRLGIFAIGGGWVVQLPVWIEVLVYLNPVSYMLDLLRFTLLGFEQLPLWSDLVVTFGLPWVLIALAAWQVKSMLNRRA